MRAFNKSKKTKFFSNINRENRKYSNTKSEAEYFYINRLISLDSNSKKFKFHHYGRIYGLNELSFNREILSKFEKGELRYISRLKGQRIQREFNRNEYTLIIIPINSDFRKVP